MGQAHLPRRPRWHLAVAQRRGDLVGGQPMAIHVKPPTGEALGRGGKKLDALAEAHAALRAAGTIRYIATVGWQKEIQ